MAAADDIRRVVEEVLKSADVRPCSRHSIPAGAGPQPGQGPVQGCGVFADVDGAVKAAAAAQRELVALPLEARARMIGAMRQAVVSANESLSGDAVSETGMGNLRDKQVKNTLAAEKTPGPRTWSRRRSPTSTG